ncbi:MAG: ABC transporter permease, partial [Planctomycetota bacterium]
MRSVYIALLTIFVAFVWIERVSWISWGDAYSASRMAEAGKYVVNGIVRFQFYAIQVLAVIMLSGSISEEIYSRTLNVLMSTPISSFQIVMGKLLSRMLQLMILLAISLPLLAIVRVFGGVPWDFLISGLCITVTAAVFVGSISLFFSIFLRRFYIVIIVTMVVVVTVYFFLPLSIEPNLGRMGRAWLHVLYCLNPLIMMLHTTRDMLRPGIAGGIVRFWPVHCGLMLCISAVVLLVSARLVRKAALRQAAGKRGVFGRLFMRLEEWSAQKDSRRQQGGEIRRVMGPALVWKELVRPVSRRQRLISAVIIGAEVVLILMAYAFPAAVASLGHYEAVLMNVWILMGLGILFTSITSATSITTEKEARSWPLLLGTDSSEWQIILGKFAGVLRRSLLVWALLLLYFVMFWRVGIFHPIGILQITMVAVGTIVF